MKLGTVLLHEGGKKEKRGAKGRRGERGKGGGEKGEEERKREGNLKCIVVNMSILTRIFSVTRVGLTAGRKINILPDLVQKSITKRH